jgi:hypothetical protein
VSLLLERLKAENRVDVFQTVKTLQAMRAHTAHNFVSHTTVIVDRVAGPIQIHLPIGARLPGGVPMIAPSLPRPINARNLNSSSTVLPGA